MVRRGDFEVSLVHADTKEPFKEHIKDGMVYVEVEPDEEYFIRVHRVANSFPGVLLAKPSVDGYSLSYSMSYSTRRTKPDYFGLWAYENGKETETSLKFTKPRNLSQGVGRQSGLLMGKVDIGIFEGLFCGYGLDYNFKSSWQGDQSQGAMGKKCLRSGQGSVSFTTTFDQYPREQYMPGRILDIITLNYCAALGLIQVGVLPKPPLRDYQRMVNQYTRVGGNGAATCHPDPTASSTTSPPVPIITPIRIKSFCGRVEELYDLTHLDDDDE